MPPINGSLSAAPFDPTRGLLAAIARVGLTAYLLAEGARLYTQLLPAPPVVQDGDFGQAAPPDAAGSLGDGGPSNAGWFAPTQVKPVKPDQADPSALDLTPLNQPQDDADPSPVSGEVYQVLNTTQGSRYGLSFRARGDTTYSQAGGNAVIGLMAFQAAVTDGAAAGGPALLGPVSPPVPLPTPGTPNPYTSFGHAGDPGGPLAFVAKSGQSRLDFTATSRQDFFLTDVVVSLVPAPSAANALVRSGLTLAALGLGLAAAGAVAGRKAQRP